MLPFTRKPIDRDELKLTLAILNNARDVFPYFEAVRSTKTETFSACDCEQTQRQTLRWIRRLQVLRAQEPQAKS